jgi:hypothetical protein
MESRPVAPPRRPTAERLARRSGNVMETTGCNRVKNAGLANLPKRLDLADSAAWRNPLKRFGHTCHAGGRGFESRRSRLFVCPANGHVVLPGWARSTWFRAANGQHCVRPFGRKIPANRHISGRLRPRSTGAGPCQCPLRQHDLRRDSNEPASSHPALIPRAHNRPQAESAVSDVGSDAICARYAVLALFM